jgi:ketopantoate reductase
MKILIYGAGALGRTIGGKLIQSGQEVYFFPKEYQKENLIKNGIILESIITSKRIKIHPVNIFSPSYSFELDYLILCVRMEQIKNAVEEIKKMKITYKTLVAIQTGLDETDIDENLIIFAPSIVAYKVNDITKFLIPFFPSTAIGRKNGEIDQELIKLKEIFNSSGIRTKIVKDIMKRLSFFLSILIPLTSALISKNCSTKGLIKDMNTIKIGVKGIKEICNIYTLNFGKFIPTSLFSLFIWIFLYLFENEVKGLVENYSKNMKEQTKFIMNAYINLAKKRNIPIQYINKL